MDSLLFRTRIALDPESPRYSWHLNRSPIFLEGRLRNKMVEFWVRHHEGQDYLGKARLIDFTIAPINTVLNAITHFWLGRIKPLVPSTHFVEYLQDEFLNVHFHDLRAVPLLRQSLEALAEQLTSMFLVGLRVMDLSHGDTGSVCLCSNAANQRAFLSGSPALPDQQVSTAH